jgi:hypothetical protein
LICNDFILISIDYDAFQLITIDVHRFQLMSIDFHQFFIGVLLISIDLHCF